MGLLDAFNLDGLVSAAGNALGNAGQMKAAKFCFEVYTSKVGSKIQWDDLSVNEQKKWAYAVWEVMNKGD